jgi:hypothetical protein
VVSVRWSLGVVGAAAVGILLEQRTGITNYLTTLKSALAWDVSRARS